ARELSNEEILAIFESTYFAPPMHLQFVSRSALTKESSVWCKLHYIYNGKAIEAESEGNGPIDACRKALLKDYPNEFVIRSYFEHSCGEESSALAVAYIEIETKEGKIFFGVGKDSDITLATIKALFSALNRAFKS
ncbi:MAG: 2-isopropylmalate synthase, partial [Thiovulaceae bacterium]|nr:2-isopropylmalate synthase [Sulfurimonadaceae bacterium]